MTHKSKNKIATPWLLLLATTIVLLATTTIPPTTFAATCQTTNTPPNNPNQIPSGPGQICISNYTRYIALIDWASGSPAELSHPVSISYDDVAFFQTVNSCVNRPPWNGAPPEGNFPLLIGGLVYQAAMVNIKKIDGQCAYQLTYYWLTNPISCGPCQPTNPLPANTPNPDIGDPECNKIPM